MDKIFTNIPPSSINEGYKYTVTIARACPLFQEEPLKDSVPNFGEMTIVSNTFDTHQDCQDDVISLLTSFSKLLARFTNKQQVIATKINPMHGADYDPEADVDAWEGQMIMKMFLADLAALQNEGRIDGQIMAVISAAPKINLSSHAILIPQ